MYAKQLRENLARLANDMRAIVDTAKNDKARGLSSEEREKFHALETEYSGIEDSIKVAEKSASILDSLKTVDPTTITKDNIDHDINADGIYEPKVDYRAEYAKIWGR